METQESEEQDVKRSHYLCPYLERRDERCATLLTLTNLREAFRLCAGDHSSCDIHQQIQDDDARSNRECAVARTA